MHNLDLVLTITGGLAAALLFGYITRRLGLSPIVGYLLAGVVVGPYTPGFVADKGLADQLAELGVILLMFGVGLHFHVEELLAVRRVAIPGALVQSLVATGLGCALGLGFGWGWPAGVVFGLAISVASTVVLVRVLSDHNDLHTPAGRIAVGWLIVEDIFTVLVLVLLPVVFQPGQGASGGLLLALGWSVFKIVLSVILIGLVGGHAIPWLLSRVAATRSRELFTLTVLVVALGIAVGSAKLFGVSMALGAFLAGLVVGRSDFSSRAASEALPMRDAFAVLFFVSVGMLFNPAALLEAPGLVAATLAIILIGKPVAALAIALVLGYPLRTALSVAVVLAQIGEFSFILATVGNQLRILPPEATQALVAAAIVSISINPILYGLVGALESRAERLPILSRWLSASARAGRRAAEADSPGTNLIPQNEAVVVGYGPVGRTLVRLLSDNGVQATVIELNLETVHLLRRQGLRACYGDGSSRETLMQAGVEHAVTLILSSSGMHGAEQAIRLAREVNPKIRVFARAAYLREVPALTRSGADVVFAGEGEVALAMTEFLLRQLGATAEQIDRERERVRDEFFARPPDSSASIPEAGTVR